MKDRRKNSIKTLRRGILPALGLVVSMVLAESGLAQAGFDPLDPFEGLSSGAVWVQRFRTAVQPDRSDRFNNLTAGEWWNRTWGGQWTSAASEGKSFPEFYSELQGRGTGSVDLRSPYPYTSAEQHWNAWREAANGGTKHTRDTLPNWSGDWESRHLVTGGAILVRDVWAGVSEDYKPRFAQALQAELEGSHWWPADECMPNGYFRDGWNMRYAMLDEKVMIMAEDQPVNEYRITYHDGRDFVPEDMAFPMWYGQSQGFWDGDELIIWVKDIKGWFAGHGLPEYSDQLQIVERWKRIGDEIVVDITMYDPVAFAFPWHEVVLHVLREDWRSPPPAHNECVSTNNAHHDDNGRISEFTPEDVRYKNIFDPRPWAAVFDRIDQAKESGRLPEASSFLDIAGNGQN